MAATLKDVSKLAGVAPCTVSYVLSGKAETMKISASTVRKVLDAARKLNYRANLIAKNLRRQQTRTVGVVFNDLTSSWTDEVTAGIYDVLLEADYQPFLGVTYFDAERERRIINTFLDNQVEGLILQPLHASAEFYRQLNERYDLPVAFIGESVEEPPAKAFMLEARAAGRAQIDHLYEQGFRRIAVLSSDNPSIQSDLRRLGAEERLRELGLPYPEEYRRITRNMSAEQDAAEAAALVRLPIPPDAIAVSNDVIACRVMSMLSRLGQNRIGVIGIGDLPESSHDMIRLSSIGEPRREMGRACAEYLLDVIGGREIKNNLPVFFAGELQVRASTLYQKQKEKTE
ncbi:LacI family DNA-binding transcriptional regulator [uncultured Victivallis sp.]|jgi:HTH-type transcriptional regulator regA|uniref:LacI family DNA-binding transcriptional regulator n=1 Tax=uncultured Victivallis sp. TaxID=354118 RepID=UPI002583092F|nr:LacI family DNA-binding transcriptional regulator [uncultured Victivallis sp.]